MENPTTEQIQKHVLAAFDSVNLVNTLKEKTKKTLTPDDTATISRNVEHLKIMMKKEWFAKALTATQKSKINTLII